MKKSTLAMIVSTLTLASAAPAAETYNKDGNKQELYGTATDSHYFSNNLRAAGANS